MNISPADLIKATAGREKGGYFMVLHISDGFVMICDGKGRTVNKPKKKKIKHIKSLDYSLTRIRKKLEEGKEINNSEIRKEIRLAKESLKLSL